MKLRRLILAGAAIAVGGGAAAALAAGGGHGKGPSDLFYTSATTTVPNNTQVGTTANCGSSSDVIGGGVYIGGSGTYLGIEVATSSPYDGSDGNDKPDDLWTGYANNQGTGGSQALVTHIVCAAGVKLKYVHEKFKIPDNSVRTKKAPCPRGTSVAGGGIYITGTALGIEVASLEPYDGGDRDRRPDDGFRVSGGNDNSGQQQTGTAYAICTNDAKLSYVKEAGKFGAGNIRGDAVKCPKGTQVVDGGVQILKGLKQGKTTVATSRPWDKNGDLTASEGWEGVANNASSKDRKMATYAICVKKVG